MKDKRLEVEVSAGHRYRNKYLEYIHQPIELKKGMFAIECKDVIDVSNALETVRQMVLNGTLDIQLVQASGEIRMKFGVRGCPGDMV
mgnify:CR=1 FL=1